MDNQKLAVARRHVLGELYGRCEHIATIPVYLKGDEEEMIGFVDEGLGVYADAFVFHLNDQVCKRLAAGQYTYSFDCSSAEKDAGLTSATRRSVVLDRIILVPRKGYEKPIPRSAAKNAELAAEKDNAPVS